MPIRSRDRGESENAKWPYPYGSDLHWFWGWAYRMENWLDREEFDPSEHDWMLIRADREAADAMLRYSIDFPALIQEVKQHQRDVESRWEEALNNDAEVTREAYSDALDVLIGRIYKVCELIFEREAAQIGAAVATRKEQDDEEASQEPPRNPKTLPDGSPFTSLQMAIMRALRGQGLTKEQLAKVVAGGDSSRFFKPGGLKELKDAGYVLNKPGVGYYRPDSPPIFEDEEEN